MGISFKVARWLNENGYDAVHLSEQGLYLLDDFSIVSKSSIENRIILTSDMDFGQILIFHNIKSTSVIQFRNLELAPSNVIDKLLGIFERFNMQLNSDPPVPVIITVQENKVRLEDLSI
jgi:predicted nuclease of predicted toxin-antitoxin system